MYKRQTADCTDIPVLAGPVEATALGNIVLQLIALGEVKDVDEGRALIARTEKISRYSPQFSSLWKQAAIKYEKIGSRNLE